MNFFCQLVVCELMVLLLFASLFLVDYACLLPAYVIMCIFSLHISVQIFTLSYFNFRLFNISEIEEIRNITIRDIVLKVTTIPDTDTLNKDPFTFNSASEYSKTCLKQSLINRQTKMLMTNGSLMQVKSIAECSKLSILQYS